MNNRIKIKNIILKEVANTRHQLDRFKTRFNILCQGHISSEDKNEILRNLNTLNQIDLDNKSYAVRIGGFKVNKDSEFYIDVNGRGYYRVNDELFKDSTGNEFWAIVRNNRIITFMLRKDIQSRDVEKMKDRLRVDDVIFDVNKINKPVSEEVIDEDFDSQNMIEQLSKDMLKSYISQYVEHVYLSRSRPKKFLVNAFKGLKYSYGKFNEFIRDFTIYLGLSKDLRVRGQFQPTADVGDILIQVDENILYDYIIENHKKYSKDEIKEELYYYIGNINFFTVLRHELQHAYDYYISGGKFTSDKKSKDFYAKKRGNVIDTDPKTKEIMRVKYLRLQHEINARFTQTITELNDYGLHNGDGSFVSIQDYLNTFKKWFYGWDIMTPKVQKYLMRRASQYYHKYKEEFDKNKKGE